MTYVPISYGVVEFQAVRRAELRAWAAGNRYAEGPAVGGVPAGRLGRSLAEVWSRQKGRAFAPKVYPDDEPPAPDGAGRYPFAGKDDAST